nr:DUF2252 family protein [Streptomyces anulatus]
MTENHLDGRGLRHHTPQERAALGKAARAAVPRSSHAWFSAGPGRPDPLEIIEKQSATRLPELVPIRYGRMSESPFRFYRGAAAIMASDLADTPQTGFRAQLCGEAHLLNFRLLASPERRLMFDINDFDETLPGPWEWDVKRLAASLVIAGRSNGFSTKERAGLVRATVRSYRESMRAGHDSDWLPWLRFWLRGVHGQLGCESVARQRAMPADGSGRWPGPAG